MKINDIYNIINEEVNNIVIDDDKMRDEYLRKFNYFLNKDLDDLTLVHIFKWLRILGINNSNKKYDKIFEILK